MLCKQLSSCDAIPLCIELNILESEALNSVWSYQFPLLQFLHQFNDIPVVEHSCDGVRISRNEYTDYQVLRNFINQ